MAVVRAEVEIEAPVERVWQTLTDLAHYSDWNPFTPRVESSLEPGTAVHLHVRLRRERLAHRVEFVTAIEPPTRLCWGAQIGARSLLTAERCQVLTRLAGGRTRYVTEDVIRGLLTPVVMAFWGGPMRRGFGEVALALKARVEAREKEEEPCLTRHPPSE
jgi:hypothetical protein